MVTYALPLLMAFLRKDVSEMRRQMVPGLFAEQDVACDDALHKLKVGLYLVQLSVIQYTLVMALVFQRERWIVSRHREPLFVSIPELMQRTQVTSVAAVRQHLYRAHLRLMSHDIMIGCLASYGLYAIFPKSDFPPEAKLFEL